MMYAQSSQARSHAPAKDEIVDGIRKNKPQYPEIIIRELLANALIHQDFTLKGVGPTVEIFDGWFEITNPGELLIDEMRIIDNPPKSRNEALAMLMRRCHICEEEGSGWDKIINAAEENLLPAPRFMTYPESALSVSSDEKTVFYFCRLFFEHRFICPVVR